MSSIYLKTPWIKSPIFLSFSLFVCIPSLFIFRMVLSILLGVTALVFILLMRFLLQSLVSRKFLVLLNNTYFFISVWWCSLIILLSFCNFLPFSFWFFPVLTVLLLPLFLFFPQFITRIVLFSMQNFIPIFLLYIFIFWYQGIQFFFIFFLVEIPWYHPCT